MIAAIDIANYIVYNTKRTPLHFEKFSTHKKETHNMGTEMTQEEKSILLYEKIMPLLEDGKTIEIHPHGFSMYPLITSPSDSVIVQPTAGETLKTGDILLYRRKSGLLVLHRICRIKEDGFYFVGDNQTEIEGPLQTQQLLAKVTHIKRKGHTFSIKHPVYRICSRIWLILRPVRPFISRPIGKIWRMLRGTSLENS